MNLNPDTIEYPETEQYSNLELLYTDEPKRSEETPDQEWTKEETPLNEEPNPLSNSELIFGERRSAPSWQPFSFDESEGPKWSLERKF